MLLSTLILLAFFRVYDKEELDSIKFVLASDRNITVSDDDIFIEVLRVFNLHQERAKKEEEIARGLNK